MITRRRYALTKKWVCHLSYRMWDDICRSQLESPSARSWFQELRNLLKKEVQLLSSEMIDFQQPKGFASHAREKIKCHFLKHINNETIILQVLLLQVLLSILLQVEWQGRFEPYEGLFFFASLVPLFWQATCLKMVPYNYSPFDFFKESIVYKQTMKDHFTLNIWNGRRQLIVNFCNSVKSTCKVMKQKMKHLQRFDKQKHV